MSKLQNTVRKAKIVSSSSTGFSCGWCYRSFSKRQEAAFHLVIDVFNHLSRGFGWLLLPHRLTIFLVILLVAGKANSVLPLSTCATSSNLLFYRICAISYFETCIHATQMVATYETDALFQWSIRVLLGSRLSSWPRSCSRSSLRPTSLLPSSRELPWTFAVIWPPLPPALFETPLASVFSNSPNIPSSLAGSEVFSSLLEAAHLFLHFFPRPPWKLVKNKSPVKNDI